MEKEEAAFLARMIDNSLDGLSESEFPVASTIRSLFEVSILASQAEMESTFGSFKKFVKATGKLLNYKYRRFPLE